MADHLRFCLSRMQREVEAIVKLANPFIDPASANLLNEARAQLRAVAGRRDQSVVWRVPEERPIRTKKSAGEYESRNHGDRETKPGVVGLLSFRWEMRTPDEANFSDLLLTGNATTMIRLLESDSDRELAMWRMEIGPEDAPGACFHTQIRGAEDKLPFPSSLPVPRLPSLPPVPMSCLEFLLSELFQYRWRQEVLRGRDEARFWRDAQKARLGAFLNWQQGVVESATGSPLVRLKEFPGELKL